MSKRHSHLMLKETSPQVPIQTTSFRQSLEVISEYNASFLIFCFALLLGVLSLFDIVLPANVLLAISFVFPVFVTERAWITNHTSEVQFMKQLVSKFKTMFMAGGIVLSVSTLFYFPLLVINPFPFQSISGNVIWLSIAFFLALTLSLILLIPSFYKIQNEEPTTHVIYRLVSSSDQLIALGVIMYAFTSFATISFIEVLKFATFSLEQNLVTNVEIYFREFSYFLALVFYFLMLLLSLYIFITIISFYFIRDGRLSLPSRDILMFVMRRMLIGLLTFLVAIFLIPLISGNLGLLWITVGFNIGLSVYLMNRKLDGEICDKCHSIKIEHPKPLCINCDVETNVKIPFKLPNVRQVRVPQCPSCGKIWDSPTRQCSNCRYTVILACPNCGQTLNPLWTNCVKCKVGLTPMPKKALETKRSCWFPKIYHWFSYVYWIQSHCLCGSYCRYNNNSLLFGYIGFKRLWAILNNTIFLHTNRLWDFGFCYDTCLSFFCNCFHQRFRSKLISNIFDLF